MFRFGVMGAGSIAGKFVDAARHVPECRVTAIASRSLQRAEDFAARHGIPAAYGSYEAMLAEEKLDAVYIATYNSSHAELARTSIGLGVPVLCEKAMFMNSRDAREVLSLAREKGVFCMETMWSRFLPAVQEMKRRLDAGEIGTPLDAEIAIGWRPPRDSGNRFFDPTKGGGAAFDLLVYAYELADFFLGRPDAVENVRVSWGETGVDEAETVTLRWSSDAPCEAVLSASIVEDLGERAVIRGTGGTLFMPRPHMAEGLTITHADGSQDQWRDTQTVNGFVYEVAEVVRCVRAGLAESPTVPHDLTIRCAEVFDRINASRPEI